jgi:hypothetical protein
MKSVFIKGTPEDFLQTDRAKNQFWIDPKERLSYLCLLKNCMALSCFWAASFVGKVPKFLRFPVFGLIFRE